ncbi:hypothetical protein BJX70DRAFT_3510 [Aspergillus crustosus]
MTTHRLMSHPDPTNDALEQHTMSGPSPSERLSLETKTAPGPAPNGQGRGLFATTDLRVGDTLLHVQEPFVAVLDSKRLEDTCSACFSQRQLAASPDNGITLKACTGCKVIRYCDKTCQAKDWKLAHSRECKIFKDLQPKVLPINARALLRVVLRARSRKNPYTQEELQLFQSLGTHIRDIREGNTAQWERISLTSKAIKEYSKTEMEEEDISAYGAKLDLNSFNLTNSLYDRLGLYLHPYTALINHSCDYNAMVAFDGPQLYIKAIRPIAKNDQIFVSYIDTTFPKRIRQKEVRERYFFTCSCTKCTTPDPPTPTGDAAVTAQTTFNILEQGLGAEFQPGTDEDNNKRYAVIIQELISNSWPKTVQPFPAILDEMITSDIGIGEYGHAFLNCALRFSRIDPVVYPIEAHPLRLIHAFTFAKVCLHISQTDPELTLPEFVKGEYADFLGPGAVSVDYGLLGWTVLAELVSKEGSGGGGCMVPGFWAMTKRKFREVHGEFLRTGVDPREMGKEIRKEWVALGKVVGGLYRTVFHEE